MKKFKNVYPYLIIILLVTIFLVFVLKLWSAKLFTYPLYYGAGDLSWQLSEIKGIKDSGWIYKNSYLGAPFGTSNYDFINTPVFQIFILKILTIITNNWVATVNIYFLLTFYLTAIITYIVLKKLKISPLIAIVCSIIYSFLPYHFLRNINHLYIGTYFMIPISVYFGLKLFNGENLFCFKNKNIFTLNNFKSLILLVGIATFGIYYAYFSCFLFAINILYLLVNSKFKEYKDSIKKVFQLTIPIIIIVIVIIIMVLPNIIFWSKNGKNDIILDRSISDVEIYSLKIVQLLSPIKNHRIVVLSNLRNRIDEIIPLITENGTTSLGIVMSIGFVILLLTLFNKKNKENSNIRCLSIFNISCLLLATTSGFSSIITVVFPFLSKGIRCYNRIVVFIAMFSITCIAIILQKLKNKYFKSKQKSFLFSEILILILIAAIIDQTSSSFVPNYIDIKNNFDSNQKIVNRIESIEKKGTMIYELPYSEFPESGDVKNMKEYSLFVPYLHSNTLKWSFGSMKHRKGDKLLKYLNTLSVDNLIPELINIGFGGIYIDSSGYTKEELEKLLNDLNNYLNTSPIQNSTKTLIYYSLSSAK